MKSKKVICAIMNSDIQIEVTVLMKEQFADQAMFKSRRDSLITGIVKALYNEGIEAPAVKIK